MERYNEYKDSGVQWLGEIPSHWGLRKMKYTFCERSQKGFPNEPLLAATQSHGVILKSQYETRTVEATKSLETLKLVEIGDFVISLRPFQGGLEYAHERGIISPAYTILTPTHISAEYFRYLSKSNIFISLLKSTVTGIREGQNIDYNKLKENLLPIPPIEEQVSIGLHLDKVISELDKAIAMQQKMIDLLNERKQIIIQNAVTKGLDGNVEMKDSGVGMIGMIPNHWKVEPFGKHFTFGKGLPITKANLQEEGVAVISYGQIHAKNNLGTTLTESLVRYVSPKYLESHTQCLLNQNDFIFADTSEDIEGSGNFAFNDFENKLFAGYHTVIARPQDLLFPKYYAYLFKSKAWKSQIQSLVNGVKVYSIGRRILKTSMLLIPSGDEQKHIVELLDEKTSAIEKSIENISRQIFLLEERKQIIINEVVTGKVRVS